LSFSRPGSAKVALQREVLFSTNFSIVFFFTEKGLLKRTFVFFDTNLSKSCFSNRGFNFPPISPIFFIFSAPPEPGQFTKFCPRPEPGPLQIFSARPEPARFVFFQPSPNPSCSKISCSFQVPSVGIFSAGPGPMTKFSARLRHRDFCHPSAATKFGAQPELGPLEFFQPEPTHLNFLCKPMAQINSVRLKSD
jgi:hypothetical protein